MKNIVLFDSGWIGHHPTYFKYFLRVLLQSGYRVLAICPAPEEVREWCEDQKLDLRRLDLQLWMPLLRKFRPSRYQGRLIEKFRNRWLIRAIRKWEKSIQSPVDLVFFACLYPDFCRPFFQHRIPFPYPWSGLYLRCPDFRSVRNRGEDPEKVFAENFFSHPHLHSLAILDEGVTDEMSALCGGCPVFWFPDFAEDVVATESDHAVRITNLAHGRNIIFLGGYLQASKGVIPYIQAAQLMPPEEFFFVLVGQLQRSSFSDQELAEIEAFSTRENTYCHFQRIPSEAEFNALIKAADVLYAAYVNFPHSSNIVGKGAMFQKPLIVSAGSLMAERVRDFDLGSVVEENNPIAIAQAFQDLSEESDKRTFAGHRRYADKHSVEALRHQFKQLLKG